MIECTRFPAAKRVLMTILICLFCMQVPVVCAGQQEKADTDLANSIPSLDELAGHWMDFDSLKNWPSVNNFHGGLGVTDDISGVHYLTFAPLTLGGRSATTYIDSKQVLTSESRWYPYQAMRRTSHDGLEITSTTRMAFEDQGVLIRINISNPTEQSRTIKFHLDLTGRMRKSDTRWQWNAPRAGDNESDAILAENNQVLLISDKKSDAHIAYAFAQRPDQLQAKGHNGSATWNVTVPQGKTIALEYLMVLGENDNTVSTTAKQWADSFEKQFQKAKDLWSDRWLGTFTPGNKHFSQHLPTLVTTDDKIRRVYYMSIASTLQLYRTNMPMSDSVFVTGGPRWAVTLTYFWDAGMWETAYALLDPASLKQHLKEWLAMDLHRCYAKDYLSGQGAGLWYAANDCSVFQCIHAYLCTTGDEDFLKEEVAGETILEHLEGLATHYKTLVDKDGVLADYGGIENMLECVPTYKHRVPSFNAANVWMLRRTADLLEKTGGDFSHVSKLRNDANVLQAEVLKLYVPGQGVWSSLHRDGKKVEMRHVLDFIVVGHSLADNLQPEVKKAMVNFVERELLTKHWMRAQSLSDISAEHSDRPDHGPMGSYDGWPPLTMDVMCSFGEFDRALAFLRRTEEVTYEGPYSMSHELLGRDNDSALRIAGRGGQTYNEGCSGAFADVIIRSFFGYRPEIGSELALLKPNTPRGFSGTLYHLPHQGSLYTLTSDHNGVSLNKE